MLFYIYLAKKYFKKLVIVYIAQMTPFNDIFLILINLVTKEILRQMIQEKFDINLYVIWK